MYISGINKGKKKKEIGCHYGCVRDKYSLYSTATQNTWRRGLVLGNAPGARILRWRYQHDGIFWRYQTPKFMLAPTPTPNASQWNIGGVRSSGVGHVYFIHILCCLCIIFLVGYAKISLRKGSFQWNMQLIFPCFG